MIIDKITYAEGGIVQVKLKPIFEALRVIKLASVDSEAVNVRKSKKPTDSEILEYISSFIKLTVNSKVRTLETRIIPNKKASDEAKLNNGAGGGLCRRKSALEADFLREQKRSDCIPTNTRIKKGFDERNLIIWGGYWNDFRTAKIILYH